LVQLAILHGGGSGKKGDSATLTSGQANVSHLPWSESGETESVSAGTRPDEG
jgi:hypothetical protein